MSAISVAPRNHDALLLAGAFGATLMFIADLVLYYPTAGSADDASVKRHRTAASYFSTIDPGGTDLAKSSMQHVSVGRVMLGGTLGPIASTFYSAGFLGVFFGLAVGNDAMMVPAAIAAVGLSLSMTIAGVYHALFAYTCFLSKQIQVESDHQKKSDGDSSNVEAALRIILGLHQDYLRYVFKWAAAASVVGSSSFVYCCLVAPGDAATYPQWSVLFAPVLSGFVKKSLKRHGIGGIALCGGLTNLWNLSFFAVLFFG